MNESDILKDFIQLVINDNEKAGIDITGKEDEIIQKARWAYLINKLGDMDSISILTNLIIKEKEKEEVEMWFGKNRIR